MTIYSGIYSVQDRMTGEIVHAYTAEAPDHTDQYPFTQYNHIPVPAAAPAPRTITGRAFIHRFTPEQRIAIRALATTNPVVLDFMALLDAAIAAGEGIDLDDPSIADRVAYLAAQLPDANINSSVILA
jgi:hypothetical protein